MEQIFSFTSKLVKAENGIRSRDYLVPVQKTISRNQCCLLDLQSGFGMLLTSRLLAKTSIKIILKQLFQ